MLHSKEYSKLWQQENLFKHRLNSAKHRARKLKLEFNITEEFIKELWEKQDGKCFYSGLDMNITERNTPYAMSLDKVDANKGYTQDNVVLCTYIVNTMKSNLPVTEFFDIIKEIYKTNKL